MRVAEWSGDMKHGRTAQARPGRIPTSPLGLLSLLALLATITACGGAPSPAPVQLTATATVAPPATSGGSAPGGVAMATAAPAATVAPEPAGTAPPTATTAPIATPPPTAVATATTANAAMPSAAPIGTPWPVPAYVAREIAAFFAAFYDARTLRHGGAFDLAAVREMTGPPYRQYTVSLLERDAADAAAGRLLDVRYCDIATHVDEWQPSPDGTGSVTVSVTRTMLETRADGARAPQTATYRFRLSRRLVGPVGAAWTAWDFFDPAASAWVSQGASFPVQSIDAELTDFFRQFYAARTLPPGRAFDPAPAAQQTNFAYGLYARPLLERQRDEAERGELLGVAYTDIAISLVGWDPYASPHGGLATVDVTRTRRVVRPGGAETQTATLRFRVHRHLDGVDKRNSSRPDGKSVWFAVDYLDPDAGQWVSERGWDMMGQETFAPLPANDFG
jgi:hypothetical protein